MVKKPVKTNILLNEGNHFLIDLLKDYNKIVEQTILLEDKLKLYGDDMASYDVHINEFWIL